MRKYADSEANLRTAVAILSKCAGTEHPSTAAAKLRLGELYFRMGRVTDADPLLNETLLAQKARPPRRRLVQFLLNDRDALLYHNEPIYRDDQPVGFTTSGMYGHTLGGAVGMGYVNCSEGVSEEFIRSGAFELDVAGRRVSARASLKPMYDTDSQRVRS
jgi:hypothetical protein